ALLASCNAFPQYSRILNGRFKGGYITRHYGDPANHIHAVQLEMAQCCYMDEESFAYLPEKGQQAQQLLERVINTALQWGREQYGEPGV
ncbi:MAG: N-formylglutamate amidohydrolase, partial [Klebsiella sp.]